MSARVKDLRQIFTLTSLREVPKARRSDPRGWNSPINLTCLSPYL